MRKQNKKCKSLRTLQYTMQGSFFVSKNLTKYSILSTAEQFTRTMERKRLSGIKFCDRNPTAGDFSIKERG